MLQNQQGEKIMRSNEFLVEYYEDGDNEYSNRKIDDTRRSRLTLKHINRLRKQREIHKTEHAARTERVQQIYRRPSGQ
jgi:hypothetical protein